MARYVGEWDGGAPHDTNWGEVKADLDKLEERLAGRECFGGLDLARVNDLSAFVLVFSWTHWRPLHCCAAIPGHSYCHGQSAQHGLSAFKSGNAHSFELRKCTPRSHWFLYNGDWTPRDERGYISGLATVFASEGNEP